MQGITITSVLPLVAAAVFLGAYWQARTGFLFGAPPHVDETLLSGLPWERAPAADMGYPAEILQHAGPYSLVVQNAPLARLVACPESIPRLVRRDLVRLKVDFVIVEKATSRAVKAYIRLSNPHAAIIRHALFKARIAAEMLGCEVKQVS